MKYIAQPGGSVRDDAVIECCDKYGMAMAFTGIRREAISERNTLIAKSCGFAMLCGITIRFQKLSHSQRQVPHVLLTRPPLRKQPKSFSPFDLHVLGVPPAFVLSQDQTLY